MACLGAKTTGQRDLLWSKRMTARGVEFLENCISTRLTANLNAANAKALAACCIAEAEKLGIPPVAMEGESGSAETAIRDAIVHLNEPGMPRD